MKPSYWQYEDPKKQTVYFRGYVKEYKDANIITHSCQDVHKNKIGALEDAKKLIKQMKTA